MIFAYYSWLVKVIICNSGPGQPVGGHPSKCVMGEGYGLLISGTGRQDVARVGVQDRFQRSWLQGIAFPGKDVAAVLHRNWPTVKLT